MRERSRRLKLILCGVLVMSCLTALVFSGTQGFLQLGWGSIKIKTRPLPPASRPMIVESIKVTLVCE